jgi:hypothetical protein
MQIVFSIDVTGQEHSRAQATPLLRRITHRGAKLKFITNIARRGDAGSQISRPKLDLVKV